MEKVLLITNEHAGSVSPRTKEVIVKAIAADFKLEVETTVRRDHASELARDAVDRDFDAVLVFGGDGTINEAAQGLVGTPVALGVLPGGSTNVMARSLGIPLDPVEATAFLASHLRSGTRRRINVGRAGERAFLFSCGIGLDAEVVKRVEADPEAKRRRGEWFFARHAFAAGLTDYRKMKPAVDVSVDGEPPRRVQLVVCCNGRPFTYFKRFPVDVCPQAHLDEGLDFFALDRIKLGNIPRIAWSVFIGQSHVRWKRSHYWHDARSALVTTDRPLPMQVDGDYIGECREAEFRLEEDALDLLV